MGLTLSYKKEIISLTKELPDDKLKVLVYFAQFLKAKKEGFTYMQVKDSAEHVRNMRIQEGKKFIEELIEWQKSNS